MTPCYEIPRKLLDWNLKSEYNNKCRGAPDCTGIYGMAEMPCAC
jgi:hypothetical protein